MQEEDEDMYEFDDDDMEIQSYKNFEFNKNNKFMQRNHSAKKDIGKKK